MVGLTIALDAFPILRDAACTLRSELGAAVALSELAGVAAVRLSITDEQGPVKDTDVFDLRRAARRIELRMPATQAAVKVALEARPDLVVLAGEGWEGGRVATPLDPRAHAPAIGPVLRSLEEAGIATAALVAPELANVKAVHGLGISSVELWTGTIVDLPDAERALALQSLGDAARLAAKLRLPTGIAGGLGYSSLPEVLRTVPALERVVAGRALVSRALLVGLDRAIRDFRNSLPSS